MSNCANDNSFNDNFINDSFDGADYETESVVDMYLDAMCERARRYYMCEVLGIANDSGLNEEDYIRCLEILSKNGNGEMCIIYGDALKDGRGVEKNRKKAKKYFKKAAENGQIFGYGLIGMMYYEEQKYKKAFKYLKMSGKVGDCTVFTLAEMYQKGLYVKKNLKKAVKLYEYIVDNYEMGDYFDKAKERLREICDTEYEEFKEKVFALFMKNGYAEDEINAFFLRPNIEELIERNYEGYTKRDVAGYSPEATAGCLDLMY